MRRCRLPSSFTSLAAAGALATALVAARSLGAEQVPPSWVTQVPLSEPGGPAAILAAGSLADGSVLTVLGNWEGYRFARVSASGELLGTARFWAPSIYYSGAIRAVVDPGGDVVVGGEGKTAGGDFWLMRFDGRTGAWRWRSPVVWGAYDGRMQRIQALCLDGDGDVLVTGAADGAKRDVATLKLDGATGEVLWGPVVFDTGADDHPGMLSTDKAGNVAVVGSAGMDPDWHLFAVQYDAASGAEAWRFEWKGAKAARAVIRQGDGGLIVSAEPVAGSGTTLVALSPEGTLRWSKVLDSPEYSPSAALALAVDRGREGEAFFVVGVSGSDQVLWKLAAGSGWRIWGPVVRPGTAGSSQYRPAIATTPEGDLLVIQSELRGEPPQQTYAYSVRGSNGKPVWGPVVIPDRQIGGLRTVVTDALGNPFILAIPYDSGVWPPSLTFTFAHVSRTDGSFLAGPVEVSGDIPSEAPETVLVDGRGDVVSLVKRPTDSTVTPVVAKIEGSSGRLVWGPAPISEPSYSSSARVGLEPSGDVFWASDVGTGVVYGRLGGDTGLAAWGPIPYAAGSADLVGLAVAGSDLALLVRTTTAEGTLLQVQRVRGDTGALAFPPVTVSPVSGSYSPGTDGLVYRAGVLAVCTSRTALLDADTGAVRWGPASTPDAGPCALDDAGNLYRPYSVWTPEPGTWLEKRSVADGSLLWSAFLSEVHARGIAVDAAGDVAVASTTSGWPSRLDVRKLSGATGSPVWGPVRWEEPASAYSYGEEVAIARSGDVVVLGATSDVTATNALVLRLSGATGEALGRPFLFGGGSETYPHALGLSGELPVIGVASTVLGSAVVSWQQSPIPFVDRPVRWQ